MTGDEWHADTIRRAAGGAARSLDKVGTVVTALSALDLEAAIEGLILGGVPVHRLPQREDRPQGQGPDQDRRAGADTEGGHQGVRRARRRRRLGRRAPPAISSNTRRVTCSRPNSQSGQRHWVRRAGLVVEVLDDKALTKAGYGGIVGVGKGSSRLPRLVRLSYKGAKRGGKQGRAGRQGHHLRHRRHLHQARRRTCTT